MAKQTSPAFFSYSRQDEEFALRLAKDLRASGAAVWLDQLDISAGQRWDRAVEDALEYCPCMLLILSPSSVGSNNVMDEVAYALGEQKTLIPVLYRDCKIPFRLRRVQYIDFREEYDSGLRELLKALGIEERPEVTAPDQTAVSTESLPDNRTREEAEEARRKAEAEEKARQEAERGERAEAERRARLALVALLAEVFLALVAVVVIVWYLWWKPRAAMESVWTEFDVMRGGAGLLGLLLPEKGVLIHTKFNVNNLVGQQVEAVAFVYYDNATESPVKTSAEGFQTTDNDLCVWEDFTPSDRFTEHESQLFLPYRTIDMGDRGRLDLKYIVKIRRKNVSEALAASEWQYFHVSRPGADKP